MSNTTALTTMGDPDTAFADFLRLRVADGAASPKTLHNYKTQVGAFVTWCAGCSVSPGLATEGDIEAYRRYMIDAGFARATIGVKLQAIKRFFDAATWRGLRVDNPAQGVKAPRDRTSPEERMKFLPLLGLKRLLIAPPSDTPAGRRDRAILCLMGYHGLRVEEVQRLDLADLEIDGDPAKVTIQHGKGDKQRRIYLTDKTGATIREWLGSRVDLVEPGEAALFVSLNWRNRGHRLSVRNLRHLVDGDLVACGLKADGVSCHSLRHSAATWGVFGGASMTAVSAMLGHASIATTGIYAKVADKMKQNPAAYLERLMEA